MQSAIGRPFDVIDVYILKCIEQRQSIREIASVVNRAISVVHDRMVELEGVGLVNPPPKRQGHRSRTLTDKGKEYLRSQSL